MVSPKAFRERTSLLWNLSITSIAHSALRSIRKETQFEGFTYNKMTLNLISLKDHSLKITKLGDHPHAIIPKEFKNIITQ